MMFPTVVISNFKYLKLVLSQGRLFFCKIKVKHIVLQ